MTAEFDAAMYARIRSGCRSSAEAVCPRLDELFRPKSVVDVGGGEGWWASQFSSAYRSPVVVERERPATLAPGVMHLGGVDLTDWPRTGDYFDLALCLEVAEHLPEEDAESFVSTLVYLADVVVFSAAIPAQGGHGHLNERWPRYWADMFLEHDYVCGDIRDEFWEDARVEPWYRQNLLIFAEDHALALAHIEATPCPLPLVHPDIYGWRVAEIAELRR